MEVFPVAKKNAKGDYHDNVNSEFYIKWFENLLNKLDETGEKYIIVSYSNP